MSFLNKYAAHAQLQIADARAQSKSRIEAFVENHQHTIDELRAGRCNTTHTKLVANDHVHVTLRNGVVPLALSYDENGKARKVFKAPNVTQAIDYLQEAIQAALDGEFDELFIATAKKKRLEV